MGLYGADQGEAGSGGLFGKDLKMDDGKIRIDESLEEYADRTGARTGGFGIRRQLEDAQRTRDLQDPQELGGATRPQTLREKYPHYYKRCPFEYIDVYRVLDLFNVTDPCIGHAIKKLLAAGERTAMKTAAKDVHEAIESLQRWEEMLQEEGQK